MAKRKHPIQKIVVTESGVIRFTENEIVSHLLDAYPGGLNALAARFRRDDSLEDYEQLMMLIGYSVSGFGDLDLDRRTIAVADGMAARLFAHKAPKSGVEPDQT